MTPIPTKDGKRLIASRYRKISVRGRKVDQHRYIMEQHIGRKLERWEHVHHKNEDPHDNRIENLEVVSATAHIRHHRPGRNRIWTSDQRADYSRKFNGEKSHNARLTNEQASIIRKRANSGEGVRALARELGITAVSAG